MQNIYILRGLNLRIKKASFSYKYLLFQFIFVDFRLDKKRVKNIIITFILYFKIKAFYQNIFG